VGNRLLVFSLHFLFTGTINAKLATQPEVVRHSCLSKNWSNAKPAVVYLKAVDRAGSGFFVTDGFMWMANWWDRFPLLFVSLQAGTRLSSSNLVRADCIKQLMVLAQSQTTVTADCFPPQRND
jgi:hypothetical protein